MRVAIDALPGGETDAHASGLLKLCDALRRTATTTGFIVVKLLIAAEYATSVPVPQVNILSFKFCAIVRPARKNGGDRCVKLLCSRRSASGSASCRLSAQEVVLRGVTAFAEGTQFSKNFERFIEKVNADGKGIIRINYIGGPRAMPPFEVGNAVRTKVVDIANVTGAFYTNLMPEADALQADREADGRAAQATAPGSSSINCTTRSSIRMYLARQFHNVPFHIYLNKKPDKLDFTGLKIRVTPVYKDIVEALGGTAITTAPGEVYTALERGVVDGYGWPVSGIFDLGWDKVTKFRLEPGLLRRRGQRAGQSRHLEGAERRAAQGAERRGALARRPGCGEHRRRSRRSASARPRPASSRSTSGRRKPRIPREGERGRPGSR